jgi:hypothetical protein
VTFRARALPPELFEQSGGEARLVLLPRAGHGQRAGRARPVMTEPLAVIAPSPTVTGATSIVSEPMKARAPISVRCLETPS